MPRLSSEDIMALSSGSPTPFEVISSTNSVVYGKRVLYPGRLYRVSVNNLHEIGLCREYAFCSRFGDDEYDEPASLVFADDAQGENLLGTGFVKKSITTTEPILDKDGTPDMGKTRALQFGLDDQDDLVMFMLNVRKVRSLYIPRDIPASQSLTFSLEHLDSDATKLLQYRIKTWVNGVVYYWDGSTWTTTSTTWIDVTGSATLATFTDAVTSYSTAAPHALEIRPKADYASETCHIGWYGLHDTFTTGEGDRLLANEQMYFSPRFVSRLATLSDGATKKVYVSEMKP